MVGVLLLAGAALAGEVTLDEALALARAHNAENAVAAAEVAGARARERQARSYALPAIRAEAAALWWDGPIDARFLPGDPCADLDEAFQALCGDLVGGLDSSMRLREAATQHLSVEARQPLTGLWAVHEGRRATRALRRAAEAEERATRERVDVDVVEAWLQVAELARLGEVAARGVRALEAHGKRARTFHEAGLIGRNEVLQVEVALAGARLDAERARVGHELAKRRLALVTGALDESLDAAPIEIDSLPPLPEHPGAEPADLIALRENTEAAQAAVGRARADLVPQVGALAAWTENAGAGDLDPTEGFYVGLGLDWDVWSWGRKAAALDEADAQRRKAEAGLRAMERGAALRVEAAVSEARLAAAAWESAAATTERADENARLATARFEARLASGTEVLEAEALATKARAERVGAAFDYLLAVGRAQAALGLPVRPLGG